jgi:hypothetical protein
MESQATQPIEPQLAEVLPFPAPHPDAIADSPADALKGEERTESGRTYTFKEAAELLGIGEESTLRVRYWRDKVEPAFRYFPLPLMSIARYDSKNQPVYRLNDNAIGVLRAFLEAKAEGREDQFLMNARRQYPAPAIEPEAAPEAAVETRGAITIAAPELPQTYDLSSLQSLDAVQIDDPLALADQMIGAIDLVMDYMQSDIEQKTQKLDATVQARQKVNEKLQDLRLEKRFYQERSGQVAREQNRATTDLQNLAALLQALGKPTDTAG